MEKAMFRVTVLCAALISAPVGVAANECIALWIERNTIFDKRGYCFGSALGQGYFNNADCTTQNPQLTGAEKARVAQIKAREGFLGCAAQKPGWSVADLRNRGQAPAAPIPVNPNSSVTTNIGDTGQVRTYSCNVLCDGNGQRGRVGYFVQAFSYREAIENADAIAHQTCVKSGWGAGVAFLETAKCE